MKQANVLIVGMPRSGTSMVASVFANRGYHVANDEEELRPSDEHNPGGYWEAESLVERNVEVFRAVGYPHHNTWLFDPAPEDLAQRIAELAPLPGHEDFIRSYDRAAPWLWKDPRLCYTLGYWWKLLDPETTRVVLTDRAPESIYRSFVRLEWREHTPDAEADVLERVRAHRAAAMAAIEALDIPFLSRPYDSYASDPGGVARALSALVGGDFGEDDILFDRRFDHSGSRGWLSTRLHLFAGALPEGLKVWLKRLIPPRVRARLTQRARVADSGQGGG